MTIHELNEQRKLYIEKMHQALLANDLDLAVEYKAKAEKLEVQIEILKEE